MPPLNPLRAAAALLLLALAALASACAPPRPAAADAPNPALWRVSDEDSVVWLFGTVHLLPPDLVWRTPAVSAALAAADTVWLEAPSDPGDPAAVAALVTRLGAGPAERRLAAIVRPEERARIAAAARRANLDPAELEALRPWYAAVRLSVAAAVAEGQSAEAGVDRAIEAEAAAAGKSVRYFETLAEQLGFLAGLSPAAERRFLEATVRQLEEDAAIMASLDDAWARGDVAALERLLPASIAEAGPEVYAAVLTDRNARWADLIAAEMAGSGVAFVAVGAAHLVGEGDLPSMLEARGFAVERPAR